MVQSWLVTGGSSGVGLSLGRAVLQKGGTAVLTTRNIAKAQETAPDIEKNGGKWLQLDYADPNAEEVVKDAVTRWDVDVLVNNAGYAEVGAVEDCSTEAIRDQFEANFLGPIRITQAAIPIFRQRKAGTIANVGSSVSYTGMPGSSVYASSKAALRTVTEGLAAELAPFGIRVILFEPGRFRTNFGSGANFAGPGSGYSEPYKGTPVERVVTFLRDPAPASGDPDAAALRMYEIVTKTGLAAGENVKDRARFPLGIDAHGLMGKTAKGWSELAEATEEIAMSTDIKE